MSSHSAAAPDRAAILSFWLLIAFLAILWVAGGASRADVLGQSVVRFSAWSIIVVAILTLPRVDWRAIREPTIILGAAALLVTLQLVPLPPSIWTALPGRALLAEAAFLTGIEQPWRPLSISPSGTSNALASMIVPAAVLVLASNITRAQHWQIAIFIVALAAAGTVLGVLQFSGANFANPLINTPRGHVAGNFANRNHFALFLAIGCVLALAWSSRVDGARWMAGVALGLLVLFILMTLGTGSRSGVVLAVAGILLAVIAYRDQARRKIAALNTRLAMPFVVISTGIIAALIWLSIKLDRADSFNRAANLEIEADLRWQIWPVAIDMVAHYFPAGTGFGTFDQAFRISEPDSILRQSYINLAHNDWLQILLDGGIVASIMLGFALVWFVWRSSQAWCCGKPQTSFHVLARAGSIMIILIFAASVTDYPSRTPFIMALMALAAVWIVNPGSESASKS